MGNIASALFGGSSASSKPVNETPQAYQNLQQPTANALSQLLSQVGATNLTGTSGITSNAGSLTAPMTANDQQVLGQLMSATSPTSQTNQYLQDQLSGAYLPGGSKANPFLNATIQAAQQPTRLALDQTLQQDLPSQFTAAGQFTQPTGSSAFDRAAALAYGQGAQALGNIATNISSNAYDQGTQNQLTAAQLSQNETQQLLNNLQAQALPQMIQQYGINQGLSLYQTQLQGILSLLNTSGQVTSPTISSQSSSQTQQSPISDLGSLFSFSGTN